MGLRHASGAFVLGACALLAGCDRLFGVPYVNWDSQPDAPPCGPLSISAGRGHSCNVDYLGVVRCWGFNAEGQVQPGGPYRVLAPTQVVLPERAVQVSAGRMSTCARLVDGAVWCWGNAEAGQLGNGNTLLMSQGPSRVMGIGASAEISVGGYHACSRNDVDGAIFCWGANDELECGQTLSLMCGTQPCSPPAPVPNTEGSKGIAAGHRHTCKIGADDHVSCWGRNNHLQRGDTTAASSAVPTSIVLGAVMKIDASGGTTCALEPTGSVKCWGLGDGGQLGGGTFSSTASPVPTAITDAIDIAVGNFGVCAVHKGGQVSCWGLVAPGDGNIGTTLAPVDGQVTSAASIEAGYHHFCAIAQGDISCWGDNAAGQLGRGYRDAQLVPTSITSLPLDTTSRVLLGSAHGCAKTTDGVYCWGDNEHGQSGNASLQRVTTPQKIPTTLGSIEGISVGHFHSCAWGGGQAECWGRNLEGEMGLVGAQPARSIAIPTRMQAANVTAVSLGDRHVCTLGNTGAVSCWGKNDKGQLGDGTTTDRPSGVGLALTANKISAGQNHTCAVSTANTLVCWGANNHYQLGTGNTTELHAPTTIGGLTNVADVGVGNDFSCLRTTAGQVYCWGLSTNGAIGDGMANPVPTPKLITMPGSAAATDIYVSQVGVCAKLSSGSVACWGNGDDGQLGNNTESDSFSPSVITAWQGATAMGLGYRGTCAIVGTALLCSGENRMIPNDDRSAVTPMRPMLPVCTP